MTHRCIYVKQYKWYTVIFKIHWCYNYYIAFHHEIISDLLLHLQGHWVSPCFSLLWTFCTYFSLCNSNLSGSNCYQQQPVKFLALYPYLHLVLSDCKFLSCQWMRNSLLFYFLFIIWSFSSSCLFMLLYFFWGGFSSWFKYNAKN